jgi:hypothetical protein
VKRGNDLGVIFEILSHAFPPISPDSWYAAEFNRIFTLKYFAQTLRDFILRASSPPQRPLASPDTFYLRHC